MASVLILAYSCEERTGSVERVPLPPSPAQRYTSWNRLGKIPMEKESIRLTPFARKNLPGGSYARFGAEFWPQTNALLHVDDVTVIGEPVDKGGCQVSVLQKGTPLGEAQIGSD